MDTLSVTSDNTTTTQTVSKSYNNAGELQTLTYPDGEIVSYNNNDDGYFHGLTTANGNIVSSVNYTLFGAVASMLIGGAAYKGALTTPVQISAGYDTGQRPTSVAASINGTSIFNQTRTYDNVGNVLQLSTTIPKTTGGTATDNQTYCYDEQDRLVWAGNTGTPTGGDHCGLTPTGTTTPAYQQPYSYDALDRIITNSAGTLGYDTNHVHAATTLSSVPNQYASYDDMGNMTCRNVDTTSAHSCATGAQTGATMTYDNEGQLASWQAPSGNNETDQFLYDGDGQRVLQRVATTTGSAANVTDTITFDGYTDTTITNGTTTDVTKYYSVQGKNVAMVNSQGWFTLVPDMQSGNTLVINSNGSIKSVQLFAPYGSVRYSDGTSPTAHNYTGQRLDGTTGLLYYNSRYYDPISGRFTSTDTVETNANGSDPYAYVHDNPTTFTDPSGQFGWALALPFLAAIDPVVLIVVAVVLVVVVAAIIIHHYTSQPAAPDLNATYTTATQRTPSVSPTSSNTGGGGSYPGDGGNIGSSAYPNGGGGSTGGSCYGCGWSTWTSPNYGWIPQALPLPKPVSPPPPPPPPPVTWGSDSSGANTQITINEARSHQDDLPIAGKATGPHIYVPPKNVKNIKDAWKGAEGGFEDKKGRIWKWDTKHKDHWDVQIDDGKSHINVFPDGVERGERD